MPKKEIRHPDKERSTGAYSAAVEIDGWVYVSGIEPLDPKTAQPARVHHRAIRFVEPDQGGD